MFSRNRTSTHYALAAFTLLGSLLNTSKTRAAENAATAQETEFDAGMIQARGLDPALMAWFRQAPRFMPGESTVALTVNGSARGKFKARFDDNGQLCADEVFVKHARLKLPSGYDAEQSCVDLSTAWPQTELNLDPSEGRIDLVVPAQAVVDPGTETGNWTHGGIAGMLNYDAQYMDSAGATAGVNFMQLGTETGFNISDWIVRTRRVLVDVKDSEGKHLPHGASVFDGTGNFVTIVNNTENVFIPDATVGTTFEVQRSGITLCTFSLKLPVKVETDGFYETASAQCR